MKGLLIILGAIVALFTLWFYLNHPLATKVTIRGTVFYVDVAATPPTRERGLSGRASMAADRGMLFVHQAPGRHGFWMRGMNFPLDFIWIRDKTVVEVTRNVPNPGPNENPEIIEPSVPVDMILEVNAGVVDRIGIEQGDIVTIKN